MTFLWKLLLTYLQLVLITDMEISIARNYKQGKVGTVAMTWVLGYFQYRHGEQVLSFSGAIYTFRK